MHRAIYVIGISGVSNAGKTSLTKRLTKAFPGSHYVCQDWYFREEGSEELVIDPELDHANWESFDAMDMEEMQSDLTYYLRTKKESLTITPSVSPHFIFVDGFTIFNYRPFHSLWSKKYFVTLNKDEARDRRSRRSYEPADVPGYFDKFVWPMYLKHREEMKDQNDIVYMDGTQSPDVLFNKVCEDLKSLAAEQEQM